MSRTLSLAFDGPANDWRVYGNSRILAYQNLPEELAIRALEIEPAQAFFSAPLAWLAEVMQVGRVQMLFTFNIWVVAACGTVVYCTARLQGYSRRTALAVALLFGLGTTVWPSSRTYFRDPLAMLFLSLAWLFAETVIVIKRQAEGISRRLAAAWGGFALASLLGALSKNTVLIALPLLPLMVLVRGRRTTAKAVHWRSLLPFLALGVALITAWSLLASRIESLARFSPAYYFSVLRHVLASSHGHFWEALAAPFFSPAKSIFLYAPVLLVSGIGLVRHWRTTWTAWLYTALLVVAQGLFYDSNWWGHVNWGLRYLLPAMPGLALAAAPVLDRWLEKPGGIRLVFTAGTVSALVQLLGILAPVHQYYVEMAMRDPAILSTGALWDAGLSPLTWHIQWILSGAPADLAISRSGWGGFFMAAAFIVLSALALSALFENRRSWLTVPHLAGVTLLILAMPFFYRGDPLYGYGRTDFQAARQVISQTQRVNDIVVVKSYGSPAWYFWMNWADAGTEWISLPYDFVVPSEVEKYNFDQDAGAFLDESTVSLFHDLIQSRPVIWLFLPGDSPGASLGIEKTWLEQYCSPGTEWEFESENVGVSQLYEFHCPVMVVP
ncbi:MAG: hypothetical protein FJZ96_07770 [Chloroflexi bacterium]|nr:hypothetical protein [Chloroflexota bacterium]